MNESERGKWERRFAKDAKVLYGIDVPPRIIVRFLATAEQRYGLVLKAKDEPAEAPPPPSEPPASQ